MIDCHNHILPGVDDGARSVDESCDMARALIGCGVTTICCTPHTTDWATAGDAATIRDRVADLQAVLDERGIAAKLLPGAEAHLCTTLAADVQGQRVATLNGTTYLLLEFPYDALPEGFERVVFELQVQGVRPILAHPERIAPIADDPRILYGLVKRGCLGQLTAMSLVGGFGPRIREVSELLLEHNLVHMVASDAHDARPDGRLFALPDARQAAAQIVGSERTARLFEETPARIMAGESIEAPEPIEPKKRSFGFLKAFR